MQQDRRALGGNGDLRITPRDEVLEALLFWNDGDADGVPTPTEGALQSMSWVSATSLRTRGADVFGAAGRRIPLWSRARACACRGATLDIVDVYFVP